MNDPQFDVYGKRIAVQRMDTGWTCFLLGSEGKRRPANELVIPAFVTDDEILQYLADVLHECATPHNGEPKRLRQLSRLSLIGHYPPFASDGFPDT